jgi:citrate lyase subunit beta/citryl-CoA lyase
MPIIDGELVRRTMLFVPTNVPRFVEKAYTRKADCILLDLEDSIPLLEKEAARGLVKETIPVVGKGGADVFVRINHLLPMACKDVEASLWPGLHGIVYPKASMTEMVKLDKLIAELEEQRGLTQGSTEILPLIETAKGIIDALQIATSSPRIRAMAGGVNLDTCLEIGCEGGPEMPWGPAIVPSFWFGVQEWIILACTAASIQPMGTGSMGKGPDGSVYSLNEFSYTDVESNFKAAVLGRQMGFKGTMCIHPAQIEPLNRGFTPTHDEVDWARRALKAFETGVKLRRASVPFEGRMIDIPVAERAKKLQARAERISKWERMKAEAFTEVDSR